MKNKLYIYFALFIISCGYESTCEELILKPETPKDNDKKYIISLSNYDEEDPKPQEFSNQDFIPANSNVTFLVTDIPKFISFIIFQIHSFQSNVTLSYSEKVSVSNDSISGSNIGLYYNTNGKSSINMYVLNNNNKTVEALFVVLSYKNDAPIPGGCNMEFNMEISPFQKVFVTNSMIFVDAQASSAPIKKQNISCDKNLIEHDAYHFFLPGQDFTSETYFSAIKKLLTPENIMRNGVKIPKSLIGSSMRRVYSAYPGVGSVYAMVATYKNQSAAYVPSFTYGCSSNSLDDCGSMLPNALSKTVCALMIILGGYLMFNGHMTPNGTIFIFSCLGGGLVGYILSIVAGTLDPSNTIWIAIGSGLLFALLWQILSCCFCGGTSRIFSNIFLAFFFFCIVYYKLPDRALPFENDFYFSAFLFAITLLLFILISITVCLSGVLCCSILGSYLLIVALDYYIGSTLKYIIINVIRRITISGFDVAIISPPFGTQEITLTVFWVIFASISVLIQMKICCGKSGYLTIPVGYRDNSGNVHFAPWRDNFRAHRNLRRMYR
ncbi:transmembrane 7 superfamily member 3-like [Leptopilina boulardi]|uniref:transmembrane 7 superfamily member 3-like n=1 Tax=Leptopilina boulardi TaxID=63433 RepID=UPI0021F606A9|nr:transmembrane 7 superfamily member 3-like [Leptopilina boulardi]